MSHEESHGRRDPVGVLHAALLANRGQIAAAAKSIGRSPGVLYNKLSDATTCNELSAREAIAIAHHLKTTVYAEAICEEFGGVFMPVPHGSAGDDDVLQAYLDIVRQMGDLSREFTEARDDGIIEPGEFAAIKMRANRSVAAVLHLVAELETMVCEVPPAAPSVTLARAVG